MSKIVRAVNAMVANADKIGSVIRRDTEYFFVYRQKYNWSIRKDSDGEVWLFYYPGNSSIESLAALDNDPDDWNGIQVVSYSNRQINTNEATQSFTELFGIVQEKLFGVDQVLDDIISDDIPF